MVREYLVYWSWAAGYRRHGAATVVSIDYPPHEQPKGSTLLDLVEHSLMKDYRGGPHVNAKVHGVTELATCGHSIGAVRDLTVSGQVGTLECTAAGWRVHMPMEMPT